MSTSRIVVLILACALVTACESRAVSTELPRDAFTVTHGAVTTGAHGVISVRDPEVRAVAPATSSDDATLRFTYAGPSDGTAPLASGEVRRQVGLKLRAQNGCNLIYVMWRFEPKAEIVVSVKENAGQRTHAECGARGYRNVTGDAPIRVTVPLPSESHMLTAHLEGQELTVTVDGGAHASYALGAAAAALRGPAGFRTDNANVDLTLQASAGAHSSGAPEDD